MFEEWCNISVTTYGEHKSLYILSEKNGGRMTVRPKLANVIRSHYANLEHIATDIQELGYPGASAILRERLPQSQKARSGEIGEILATEFFESQTDFRVPVRRLRYKDGRDMALRGDDFLGIWEDAAGKLYVLKGEAKSRQHINASVIAEARDALSNNNGRPTTISLLFVADQLRESDDERNNEIARKIREAVGLWSIPANRTTHAVFCLSGNNPGETLEEDLTTAGDHQHHVSVGFRIQGHGEFIAGIYKEAANLGDE